MPVLRPHLCLCCALTQPALPPLPLPDLVADIRAKQSCWQLCLNEGSLHFGRLQGGDASHDAKTHTFFNVYAPVHTLLVS